MKAIIFDIDGTLADVRDIKHHLIDDGFDSDKYHKLAVDAPAVEWVVKEVDKAHTEGFEVLLVTARKIKYAKETAEFVVKNDIYCDAIFMRDDDDERPDYEQKKDLLTRIYYLGYDVSKAYDDNPAIIKLWQEAGIETVFVEGYGFDY